MPADSHRRAIKTMILPTLFIAALAILTALRLHPTRALGLLIASMLIYPEYLRVPFGLAQMSLPRLIALALLTRMLLSPRRRLFRWQLIDSLILCSWLWNVFAAALAGADQKRMVEVTGSALDTLLMYFTARLCLLHFAEYRKLLLPLVLCALLIGALGALESIASWSPYQSLRIYIPMRVFDSPDRPPEYRMGLLRALASTSVAIYFGMGMFMIFALLVSLQGFFRSRLLWLLSCAAAFAGTVSSLSSGPLTAVAVFLFASAFYYYPRLIKPLLLSLLLLILALETVSSRHFWHLMEYVNVFSGDYWYRGRLIEVALQQWSEYWLVGVGSDYPQHWGALIDGRQYVDLVNQYILAALNGGLLGLALFLSPFILALRLSTRAWTATPVPPSAASSSPKALPSSPSCSPSPPSASSAPPCSSPTSSSASSPAPTAPASSYSNPPLPPVSRRPSGPRYLPQPQFHPILKNHPFTEPP